MISLENCIILKKIWNEVEGSRPDIIIIRMRSIKIIVID
jgi:hypothetical protein